MTGPDSLVPKEASHTVCDIHPQDALTCLLDDCQMRFIYRCPACGWCLFGRDDGPPGHDVGMVTFHWFTQVNEHLKRRHPGAMAFELGISINAAEPAQPSEG